MKIGRVTKHWNRTASPWTYRRDSSSPSRPPRCYSSSNRRALCRISGAGDLSEQAHERFNQGVNQHFEGTRDYIVTHYKTNTRRTPSTGVPMPPTAISPMTAEAVLDVDGGQEHRARGRAAGARKGYPVFLGIPIMAGMGIFPTAHDLRQPTPQRRASAWPTIDNLLERSSANYPDAPRRARQQRVAAAPTPRCRSILVITPIVSQPLTAIREFSTLDVAPSAAR